MLDLEVKVSTAFRLLSEVLWKLKLKHENCTTIPEKETNFLKEASRMKKTNRTLNVRRHDKHPKCSRLHETYPIMNINVEFLKINIEVVSLLLEVHGNIF